MDYRALNKQTIRNLFPLPRTDVLIDQTRTKVYSVIDLYSAYHQVQIHDPDIAKTAFVTPFGHYEFVVLPFGLTNAPATFQTLMNSLLGHLPYVVVYLDDILIFSETTEQHIQHVREVLSILSHNRLHVKGPKCFFFKSEVSFLGHVLRDGSVLPDPEKISAVSLWPTPTTVKDVQSFLGLANYYRPFVRQFSAIAKPLTNLLKKDTTFHWTELCHRSFIELKQRLTSALFFVSSILSCQSA